MLVSRQFAVTKHVRLTRVAGKAEAEAEGGAGWWRAGPCIAVAPRRAWLWSWELGVAGAAQIQAQGAGRQPL